ncbi:hypothetical protein [Haloferax volcanii]|uniref:hypothetical protein n=1 Tax=Haloferax volcanii TaxID=2246 RepID=UPI003853A2B7
MEDVPQPAPEPYSKGDHVRIYLGEEDPDSEHHGRVCIVNERLDDGLAATTERDLDGHLYRLNDAESGEPVPVDFRHTDLVLVEE